MDNWGDARQDGSVFLALADIVDWTAQGETWFGVADTGIEDAVDGELLAADAVHK